MNEMIREQVKIQEPKSEGKQGRKRGEKIVTLKLRRKREEKVMS